MAISRLRLAQQIFRADGYDALDAARRSYEALASALQRSGVNRQ